MLEDLRSPMKEGISVFEFGTVFKSNQRESVGKMRIAYVLGDMHELFAELSMVGHLRGYLNQPLIVVDWNGMGKVNRTLGTTRVCPFPKDYQGFQPAVREEYIREFDSR